MSGEFVGVELRWMRGCESPASRRDQVQFSAARLGTPPHLCALEDITLTPYAPPAETIGDWQTLASAFARFPH